MASYNFALTVVIFRRSSMEGKIRLTEDFVIRLVKLFRTNLLWLQIVDI
jgi:hypothetical protein